MPFRTLTAGLFALCLAPAARAADEARPAPRDIDLVLCLDVSGSMSGLIDSAKLRLWAVVNETARLKPAPNLRVALYSYGHSTYPSATGYVRKDLDLSTDLDEVYKQLNALTIGGGEEYVARVSKAALTEQKWSAAPNALKLIVVAGNEPANQDPQVSPEAAAAEAKRRDVVINTVYCGPSGSGEAAGWRDFAERAGGRSAVIDMNKAVQQVVVSTPFDKEIVEQNDKLNKTYVAYGARGAESAAKQVAGDAAAVAAQAPPAGAAANAATLERAATKAGAMYRNSEWDLVDRLKDDPKFDVVKLKDEELPEEMRKLKPEERAEFLKKKAAEREAIRKAIQELSAKRQKHVEEELKKQPKSDGEKALDDALKGMIRDQAKAKGFEVSDSK